MKLATSMRPSFWKRSHHLDKMTLRELVIAYVQYPAIIAYALLALVADRPVRRISGPAAADRWCRSSSPSLIYPLVWYLLHRWVLHSRWMFKSRRSPRVWKRIHYDHHQDPNHLEVLFGALYTTLPTIAIATAPLGYADRRHRRRLRGACRPGC